MVKTKKKTTTLDLPYSSWWKIHPFG